MRHALAQPERDPRRSPHPLGRSYFVLTFVLCRAPSTHRRRQAGPAGIWQARNSAAADLQDHAARHGMRAGKGVVEGGRFPYQPWAAKKKLENYANRQTADPLARCYLPGVPRIMYMEFPFQIFQTRDHVAMTFEWSQVFRTIYTNGAPPSRHRVLDGRLAGPLGGRHARRGRHESQRPHLVRHGGQLPQRGAAARRALHAGRCRHHPLRGRPSRIRRSSPARGRSACRSIVTEDMDRVFEYQCQAEAEEANGAFET